MTSKVSHSQILERTQYYLARNVTSMSLADVEELQELIRAHNEYYYLESNPIIDDAQYDRLFAQLTAVENLL
jgi:NAD-dependent DNA ligase